MSRLFLLRLPGNRSFPGTKIPGGVLRRSARSNKPAKILIQTGRLVRHASLQWERLNQQRNLKIYASSLWLIPEVSTFANQPGIKPCSLHHLFSQGQTLRATTASALYALGLYPARLTRFLMLAQDPSLSVRVYSHCNK